MSKPDELAFVLEYTVNGGHALKAAAAARPELALTALPMYAHRLLARDDIQQLIAKHKQGKTELVLTDGVMSLEFKRRFLAGRVMHNGVVAQDSIYADGVKWDAQGNQVVLAMGKAEAIKIDNQLAGHGQTNIAVQHAAAPDLQAIMSGLTGKGPVIEAETIEPDMGIEDVF